MRAGYLRHAAALALAGVLIASTGIARPKPTLEMTDIMIPSADAGIQLHLRNKRAHGARKFSADRIILFVHGATFPSTSAFDVNLPGGSWLDFVAQNGYDVYALDVRGYGGSTRPAAMSQPAQQNAPFADTRDAVRDISAAVDFILARDRASSLTLLGWSWGTSTTAGYAAQHPDTVGKLVLYAPLWLGAQASAFTGAYRTSTHDSARGFALAGMPKDRVAGISPAADYDIWWAATQASDPDGAKLSPPVVRSPNGALRDIAEFWSAGKALYDPAQIRASTLLVVGEWDAITPPAQANDLYKQLVNARERRLVVLSEGTHCMAIEKHRLRLMREVQNFIDDPIE